MPLSNTEGRISRRFAALKAEGKKALIPYVIAGDPSPDSTVAVMHALVAGGADIIELGVPFSDPMAEGPVIALGHERALEKGVSLKTVLQMVQAFREQDADTPVLLMGYANPVELMGYAQFADAAAAMGLDALLTVDMPPEEVGLLDAQLRRVGMNNILLVAPTTPDSRIKKIAEAASGFVYYVSVKGVTGSASLDVDEVEQRLEQIHAHTDLPVAVGFGIKDAQSAAAVAKVASGVVVGSALVQLLADAAAQGGAEEQLVEVAQQFVRSLRLGIDER